MGGGEFKVGESVWGGDGEFKVGASMCSGGWLSSIWGHLYF